MTDSRLLRSLTVAVLLALATSGCGGGDGDGGVDTGPPVDSGTDAVTEAGTDSGTDAATDGGTDASTPEGHPGPCEVVTRDAAGAFVSHLRFAYDEAGRETKYEELSEDGTVQRAATTEYDAMGRTVRFTDDQPVGDPVEREVVWTYYDDGQLHFVETTSGGVTSVESYSWEGMRATVSVDLEQDGTPDGTAVEDYDADGHLVSRDWDLGSDGSIEETLTYTYEGGVLVRSEVARSGEPTEITTYAYDALGRKTIERLDVGDDGAYERQEYTAYDEAGRIATVDLDEDGNNTIDLRTTYFYDLEGNVVRTEATRGESLDGASTYTYDCFTAG